jgi:hypothetical protein
LLIHHVLHLACTGNKWFKPEYEKKFPKKKYQRQKAIEFFINLYNSDIPMIALENPVGVLSTAFKTPNQYVHPYMFGDRESKKTGLWLKNLPELKPTNIVEPEYYIYKNSKRSPMWHYKTSLLPKEKRAKERSKTFLGIAKAMAEQWGSNFKYYKTLDDCEQLKIID